MTKIHQNGGAKVTEVKAAISVLDSRAFSLNAWGMNYAFHVDADGDLVHDHFGTPAAVQPTEVGSGHISGWATRLTDEKRELPDAGRGDFRLPAIHIRTGAGHTVTEFKYTGYEVVRGKPELEGLPATFGGERDVSTLIVTLEDDESGLEATLRYSVFPLHNAVAKSYTITNKGSEEVEIKRAASFTLNLDAGEWDMVYLAGDWARETNQVRRHIDVGTQGFQSLCGYSSHFFNPFVALVSSETTETSGPAYGLSFVYSGSFAVEVERFVTDRVRANIGLNPLHLDWKLAPGESFTAPECVAVFSDQGLGGMSRNLHRLYRNHLSRSEWTHRHRPVLLNSWEGMYFDFDAEKLYTKAKDCAELGVKLYVMDDGWFGVKHPRTGDHAGLGDWVPNPARFPNGLKDLVDRATALQVSGSKDKLKFGLWVEPEMVNPQSELYEAHPDWVLHAGKHKRTEQRNQLVLDLSRREVQDYIIDAIGSVLASADVSYVKWDNNRAIHELPSPATAHAYMLGLYRVIDSLTRRFPHILWEGCASGGGRFDPGLLHYWPQSWTSDNTDALDRLHIQFGTSLAYPPSSMGAHISAVPNHQTHRVTPLEFRAHVAMMGGSFGFELDLQSLNDDERRQIHDIVALSEKVSPYVLKGDLYRLASPESNYPAALFMLPDGSEGVLLAFCMQFRIHKFSPPLMLAGLNLNAAYEVDCKTYTGSELMRSGLKMSWDSRDYQSRVLFVKRLPDNC
ncbi:hypothetical protein CspHIS471_0102000 [Cutaneotrichosporon sp. HIS471]|nr:hypothetical protein CspHIS471_0102000 [Cutaneotrichosporon sp. HIS471]